MRGGKVNNWRAVPARAAFPEAGDTYPLSVQRRDVGGIATYGVYSAIIGGYVGNKHGFATSEEAESVMHEFIAKSKEYLR